ncbi:hypothetical protein Mapa_007408 [Marchantia paleacea]|nr:hypothetical protein Mapa_007408 [Marchantia paleacea]
MVVWSVPAPKSLVRIPPLCTVRLPKVSKAPDHLSTLIRLSCCSSSPAWTAVHVHDTQLQPTPPNSSPTAQRYALSPSLSTLLRTLLSSTSTDTFLGLRSVQSRPVDEVTGWPLWSTNTYCNSDGGNCWTDTILQVQDDGNLVLYILGTHYPLWGSDKLQCAGGCHV